MSAAWSGIELARARLHRGGDPEELVTLVRAATPLFEEAENERALGRAWRALGYARGSLQGRCADWLDASERARRYYRRSGWSTAGCLSETASAVYHGPTPVPEALEMCERLLEEATDRPGTAHVLAYLAGLHACDGRGDEAVRLLDEADNVYRDLQDDYSLANTSGRIRGRVHAVAEDHEAAQAAFRACCETFERFDDSAALASVAAELGGSLSAQGRIEEAREWSALAEGRAPAGDVIAQLSWRILKARLLAHDNRLADAEPLAMEALSLAMQTDALTHQGDVLLDVATVLTAAKRTGEAADPCPAGDRRLRPQAERRGGTERPRETGRSGGRLKRAESPRRGFPWGSAPCVSIHLRASAAAQIGCGQRGRDTREDDEELPQHRFAFLPFGRSRDRASEGALTARPSAAKRALTDIGRLQRRPRGAPLRAPDCGSRQPRVIWRHRFSRSAAPYRRVADPPSVNAPVANTFALPCV